MFGRKRGRPRKEILVGNGSTVAVADVGPSIVLIKPPESPENYKPYVAYALLKQPGNLFILRKIHFADKEMTRVLLTEDNLPDLFLIQESKLMTEFENAAE